MRLALVGILCTKQLLRPPAVGVDLVDHVGVGMLDRVEARQAQPLCKDQSSRLGVDWRRRGLGRGAGRAGVVDEDVADLCSGSRAAQRRDQGGPGKLHGGGGGEGEGDGAMQWVVLGWIKAGKVGLREAAAPMASQSNVREAGDAAFAGRRAATCGLVGGRRAACVLVAIRSLAALPCLHHKPSERASADCTGRIQQASLEHSVAPTCLPTPPLCPHPNACLPARLPAFSPHRLHVQGPGAAEEPVALQQSLLLAAGTLCRAQWPRDNNSPALPHTEALHQQIVSGAVSAAVFVGSRPRRLVGIVAVSWATYAAIQYLGLEVEIEVVDKQQKKAARPGDAINNGDKTSPEWETATGQDEHDDDDDYDYEHDNVLLFLPTGFSRQAPRESYKGTDPEWEQFRMIAKDQVRINRIRGMDHGPRHTIPDRSC